MPRKLNKIGEIVRSWIRLQDFIFDGTKKYLLHFSAKKFLRINFFAIFIYQQVYVHNQVINMFSPREETYS
jgi:hypothetical protein